MNKLVGSFFVAIGAILLVLSIFVYKDCKEFKSTSEETTATVTKVNSSTKSKTVRRNGRTKHKNVTVYSTYFEYEANGDLFDSVIELSYCMQSGDTFTVWYDKNNPSDVRNKNGSYAGAGIIASMGLMLAGIGGAMFKGYMGSSKSKLNHRE